MNIILFDDKSADDLLPLTYTRPVADIRIGILTIREKWEFLFNSKTSTITRDYLQKKFPMIIGKQNLLINASIGPLPEHFEEILKLEASQQLIYDDCVIAIRLTDEELRTLLENVNKPFKELIELTGFLKIRSNYKPIRIQNPWDIFTQNGHALYLDFQALTKGRVSQVISKDNQIIGEENVFVEEGAKISCSVINALSGPVYIGKNAEIMEGSLIRGPFALCEESTLKMGAKIYGPTTIGPHSKIGGEVNNSVVLGYSNKAHDGFLGNSVVGEWCNLGADTNTSNLKNNYSQVQVWSHSKESNIHTGLQFCGLLMGDHSKTGINTMLNTGTVVGVNANVFGADFPPKFIPSFSWGGANGLTEFSIEKAQEVAARVYERRKITFDINEQEILTEIFNITREQRKLHT
ncbi:MAG: GlmU family protein [Bacteroidetes bacterium]|nr:GlmU family protein [Bacteroidota bacterium]HET6244595.1 GlmU family protein [Bacteroidia bacterium]